MFAIKRCSEKLQLDDEGVVDLGQDELFGFHVLNLFQTDHLVLLQHLQSHGRQIRVLLDLDQLHSAKGARTYRLFSAVCPEWSAR